MPECDIIKREALLLLLVLFIDTCSQGNMNKENLKYKQYVKRPVRAVTLLQFTFVLSFPHRFM